MLAKLALTILFCMTIGSATRIVVYNYCPDQLYITELQNGAFKPLCQLNTGFYCYKDYERASPWMYLQNGYRVDATHAEFVLNYGNSRDAYAIMTGDHNMYDIPVQISSTNGGPTFTCTYRDCPEVYDSVDDPSYRGEVSTGGSFNVLFCPYNKNAFSTNLQLVESIHGARSTNTKYNSSIVDLRL